MFYIPGKRTKAGEGWEGMGLDEIGFGSQWKKSIELNKSLTQVTL